MKTRPILFSGAMVRALLDGSKTQTRRIVKPQPFHDDGYHDGDIQFAMFRPRGTDDPLYAEFSVGAVGGGGCKRDVAKFPYGQPGDRLWVRETCLGWWNTADGSFSHVAAYKADGYELEPGERWIPSIHMPRAASRITLEVTGVRVERLQDISEEDARAEGWPADDSDPCQWYAALWEQINGKESWRLNPWVWVVEFRRVEQARQAA